MPAYAADYDEISNAPASSGAWRRFGCCMADMELDLRHGSRPHVVTALLTNCETGLADPGSHWRSQTVSRRVLGLLQIAAATDGVADFVFSLECGLPECSEPAFEITLSLSELESMQIRQEECAVAPVLGGFFRRPTGLDQENWLRLPKSADRIEAMARSLMVQPPQTDADWMEEAAKSLAEMDSLASFSVQCACPGCGMEREHPVDLEAWAIARLRRRQMAVIREIHHLAGAYGWTEQQIMALPEWRRQAYLKIAGQEKNQQGGAW